MISFFYNRLELGECKPNVISSNCQETNALSCEQNPSWTPKKFENIYSKYKISTLDSGIDVAPGINIAPGTFGKNFKHSP